MGCGDAPVFLFWITVLVIVASKFIIGLLMVSIVALEQELIRRFENISIREFGFSVTFLNAKYFTKNYERYLVCFYCETS